MQNPVSGVYWRPMQDYVLNRISRCEARPVVDDIWQLNSGETKKVYFILKNEVPVAWVYLVQRKGWKAWEVGQLFVTEELRGKRVSEKLYSAIIDVDGLILASGNIHSKFSRRLWASFVRRERFNIWAQDFKNLERTSSVEYDALDDEIECDLPLYTDRVALADYPYQRTDIRLLATRKEVA